MTVRNSLLAILNLGDCHGYQLRHELDTRMGGTWPVNVGQIYSTLERLERDGLVAGSMPNEDGQIRYSITPAGRAEAAAWWESPVERTAQARDELAMKLALAVTLPGVDIAQILTRQRHSALGTLQAFTTAKRNIDVNNPAELSWVLVLDSQIFNTEAELRWLDHVEGMLHKNSARGLSSLSDITRELPRRGRPSTVKGA